MRDVSVMVQAALCNGEQYTNERVDCIVYNAIQSKGHHFFCFGSVHGSRWTDMMYWYAFGLGWSGMNEI
jgi:hypothetical protein